MKKVPTLPGEASNILHNLYEIKPLSAPFYTYVLALRQAGWPLRSISEPLGVSRVAASNWEKRASEDPSKILAAGGVSAPQIPLEAKGQSIRRIRISAKPTPEITASLRSLSELASKNTRWSRLDSPERLASRELDRLVTRLVRDVGISASEVARTVGVTRRAIMQRIERTIS